ncbi:MAG: cysteine desulfurase family protein [Akkermansiaceae bacterium]|nr:cysteine desulfurase family protein [Akkermansiaceae bacterium]
MIDLDSNATTRLAPEVMDAMLPWLRDQHANPSGAYGAAKRARQAIEQARSQVAELLGARPEEIVFTSGGTESVNAALHSLHTLTGEGEILVSAIEHSAVLRFVDALPRQTRRLGVDAGGRVELDEMREASGGAAFISLMAANNEVGTIQPLNEAIAIAREAGIPIHSDATQAIGKIPFTIEDHPADLISLSAHKFHGPKGIGALYVRQGLDFKPLLHGGGQEKGRRSGTENTAAIVAMGVAAELARRELENDLSQRLGQLRDRFEEQVLESLTGVQRNGSLQHRLPNTSHLSFKGCEAEGLIILLDEFGVQCSAGSACMTGKREPSHVQMAMGIDPATAKSSLRFSFSRLNAQQDADDAAKALVRAVEKLRGIQGSGTGPVVIYGS